MKILHVAPTYYPATKAGGPIIAVYEMNNALARLQNIDLKIISTDSSGPKLCDHLNVKAINKSIYPNQKIFFTRNQGKRNISLGLLLRLPALINWSDVVHLTGTYSFPTIPTLLFCKIFKKPLVWSLQGAILESVNWSNASKKGLKKTWVNLCNSIITSSRVIIHATSQKEKEISEKRIPRAITKIVPNGVTIPFKIPARIWQPNGVLRILFIGRLTPIKGIENLLKAISLLHDQKIELSIVGSGESDYEKRLHLYTNQLHLSDKQVKFVNHIGGVEKENAFWNADICILPSFSENFGLVIAEALAHGVPVIASKSSPWEMVEKYQCGLWISNNPESIASAILQIQSMPLEEMGLRGRKWMQNEYNWDKLAIEMKNIYQSLLGQTNS